MSNLHPESVVIVFYFFLLTCQLAFFLSPCFLTKKKKKHLVIVKGIRIQVRYMIVPALSKTIFCGTISCYSVNQTVLMPKVFIPCPASLMSLFKHQSLRISNNYDRSSNYWTILWQVDLKPSHNCTPTQQTSASGCQWNWNSKCSQAFTEGKQAITSAKVLVH